MNKNTTTPTSGAADLRATFSEMLVDLPNTEPFTLFKAGFDAMLAAAPAQPAAQQGVAYAELPTSNYAGRVYEEGFLIGTCPLYNADQMHAFADATHTLRASHGQAPAARPAQEAEPLLDYAMQIAHERELRVTGFPHDEDGAKRVFEAAVMRHTATGAPQADSVQEDAARWHWLAEYLVGPRTDLDDEIVASETVNDLRKLVEAAMNKGASHDR